MSDFLNQADIDSIDRILANYQMNDDAKKLFSESKFAVIAGPAGAGKDTLRNHMIAENPDLYAPILSTTSRDPRPTERDGVDYHFVSTEDIISGLSKGAYIQAALVHDQQVSCLDIQEISKLTPNQVGLSILIVQAETLMSQIKPDIMTAFIVPPTLEELLRRMNIGRTLTEGESQRRLDAAQKEIAFALNQDRYTCFVNDNLQTTSKMIDRYFSGAVIDKAHDEFAREVMQTVLLKLIDYNR